MINVRQKYEGFLNEMGNDIAQNLGNATKANEAANLKVQESDKTLKRAREAFKNAFDAAVKLIQQMFIASVFKKKRERLIVSGFGKIIGTLKESDNKSMVMVEAEKEHNNAVWFANDALRVKNIAKKDAENFKKFMQ